VAQHPLGDILLPAPGIRAVTFGVFGDGVDGEIAALQILLEGDAGIGVHLKAVIARAGLPLGARQGIFFAGLRVQEHGKVPPHPAIAKRFHCGGRRTYHHPVTLYHGPPQKAIADGSTHQIDLHGMIVASATDDPRRRRAASPRRPRSTRSLVAAVWLVILVAVVLTACSPAYVLQAARGQMDLMRAARPLETVLQDPATPAAVRQQLLVADSALVFARTALQLPRFPTYRRYADLRRPFVVWNVVATDEFSLEPRQWCFPVSGCLSYKGYFREQAARDEARDLALSGADVHVGGVSAYATLGWFDDPLLNTMLGRSDSALAGLLFHELAHQLIYVADDSEFNESFASLVELEGKRRWLASRRDDGTLARLSRQELQREQVLALLDGLREELATIYGNGQSDVARRAAKAAALAAVRRRYSELRATWQEPALFDDWFASDLNNARLAALATYAGLQPSFAALLQHCQGDLARFYSAVRRLGALPENARRVELGAALAAVPSTTAGVNPATGSAAAGFCSPVAGS
jgi:predicted aminopeptidase